MDEDSDPSLTQGVKSKGKKLLKMHNVRGFVLTAVLESA